MRTKRDILLVVILLLASLTAQAVLKERNLEQTLSVLCTELDDTHREQLQRVARFNTMNKRYGAMLLQTMDRCQQIELMLYSQKSGYIFDVTYACNEATKLHDQMSSRMLPFETFANQYFEQIKQYVRLVKSLEEIPDFLLTTEQQRADRDSCVSLANAIAMDMAMQRVQLEQAQKRSQLIVNKTKQLNDYAVAQYEEVRRNIFINGDQSYFGILQSLPRYWRQAKADFADKYRPTGQTHSEWRGNLVLFLFLFILFYAVISGVVSTVVIRWFVPRRFVTEEFRRKRTCIIIASAAALFAIATFVISLSLQDHNFMIMASRLLSEYAWLVVVITLSLIVRLDGGIVGRGLRVYTPIIVMGFVVFVYRITFMPNTLVNLTFPPVLLVCTIWQYLAIRSHNSALPRSDKFYTWFSLLAMVVSVYMAWSGYTLMSVQVLIWWIMQLTVIQTITVIYDLLHKYEDTHIDDDADIRNTWFYDAVYKMIIPIAATLGVAATIYWAAQVFDLTEWVTDIFRHKIVNIPDVIVISLDRVLFLVSLGFIFNYVIYLCIEGYVTWKENRTRSKQRAVSLTLNIMKYVGWGIFVYVAMVTLDVNRAGITLILTGLSTGIGFAMKDTLENLFYGLSLMSGRVKIGDVIECDGVRGKVTNINYQSTMVETIDGSVMAFLNSQLFAKNFKNMTRNHGYEMARVPVGVAYGSQVNTVRDLIIARLSALDCYDRKKGVQVLFENFGDSSVDLTVVIWVRVASRVADVARVKEEIYNALNEAGIEIPFPQTDVHVISNK